MDEVTTQAPSEDMTIDELNASVDDTQFDAAADDVPADEIFSDDDGDQPSNSEANTTEPTQVEDEGEETTDDPTQGMSEKERNAYFAQRRIADRQARAALQEDAYITELNDRLGQQFTDQQPPEDADELESQVFQNNQMIQKMAAERAIEKVQNTRESLSLGIAQAETSIPMFNPEDDSFNQALYDEAMGTYADLYLETAIDAQGTPQVIGLKPGAPPVYQFLKDKSDMYEGIIKTARATGQANALRSRANASVPTANAPAAAPKDDMFDGWDDTEDY